MSKSQFMKHFTIRVVSDCSLYNNVSMQGYQTTHTLIINLNTVEYFRVIGKLTPDEMPIHVCNNHRSSVYLPILNVLWVPKLTTSLYSACIVYYSCFLALIKSVERWAYQDDSAIRISALAQHAALESEASNHERAI